MRKGFFSGTLPFTSLKRSNLFKWVGNHLGTYIIFIYIYTHNIIYIYIFIHIHILIKYMAANASNYDTSFQVGAVQEPSEK